MKSIEKLEAMAEKKRNSIKLKQEAIKKETEALKKIETEIEMLKGEQFRNDINRLKLTPEEFENFRKVVLSSKDNLLDIISMMSELAAGERQNEDIGGNPEPPLSGYKEGASVV